MASEIKTDTNYPTTGINKYVSSYISNLDDLSGKKVVDIPAGDGRASFCFANKNAEVKAFDLFPDFFKVSNLKCEYADLLKGLPLEDEVADYIVSQEGIEHMPDQLKVFQEYNRVLKNKGELLITTPNFSNMRNRLSMFLVESDYWKRTAPSEIDSIWFSESNKEDIYFGHLFLLNIQKLRSLSVVSGFKIKEVIGTDISNSSLFLAIIFYPLLVLVNILSYFFYLKKNKHVSLAEKKRVFKEQIKLNLSFNVLVCKHLFVVLEKTNSFKENISFLRKMTRSEK